MIMGAPWLLGTHQRDGQYYRPLPDRTQAKNGAVTFLVKKAGLGVRVHLSAMTGPTRLSNLRKCIYTRLSRPQSGVLDPERIATEMVGNVEGNGVREMGEMVSVLFSEPV
jgi:hypothetical protein